MEGQEFHRGNVMQIDSVTLNDWFTLLFVVIKAVSWHLVIQSNKYLGGDGEPPCKRGSVLTFVSGDHPSVRPTRRLPFGGRAALLLLGLASNGVYQAM